jgi:negative regulator of sigma E activity
VPDNKNQPLQDAFTALLDNELPAHQIDSLSHAVSRDHALRQQLARHQMISCGVKAERINLGALDLMDAVSERLKDEPTVLAPTRWRHTHRWVQPLAGTALAASVAVLGIAFAPQLLKQDSIVPNPGIQVVAQPVTVPPEQVLLKPEQNWKTLESRPGKELAPYLKDHSEYAAQSVMPYASYVSYDSGKR